MLRAGASEVYYIESTDTYLPQAFKTLNSKIEFNGPVICESGGLRDIITPSLFIMINRSDGRADKQSYLQRRNMADQVIIFDGEGYDIRPENFCFDGTAWMLKK